MVCSSCHGNLKSRHLCHRYGVRTRLEYQCHLIEEKPDLVHVSLHSHCGTAMRTAAANAIAPSLRALVAGHYFRYLSYSRLYCVSRLSTTARGRSLSYSYCYCCSYGLQRVGHIPTGPYTWRQSSGLRNLTPTSN